MQTEIGRGKVAEFGNCVETRATPAEVRKICEQWTVSLTHQQLQVQVASM